MRKEVLQERQRLLKQKNLLRGSHLGRRRKIWGYIYKISNNVNEKIYIGQSVQVEERKRFHFSSPNIDAPLYQDMKLIDTSNFYFEIIDYAFDSGELDNLEKYHISKIGSIVPNGYNSKGGGQGGSHSDSTRLKISRSLLGRKHTQVTKDKIATALLGKKHSKETKDKIALSRRAQERKRRAFI